MTTDAPPEKMTNDELAKELVGFSQSASTFGIGPRLREAARRLSAPATLSAEYLDQMQAHVGEGGQLSHRNGVDLLRALMATRSTKEA